MRPACSMELDSPPQLGHCCALYGPGMSVAFGSQQASRGNNSAHQAACLKLRPVQGKFSATLQLAVLEATCQLYQLAQDRAPKHADHLSSSMDRLLPAKGTVHPWLSKGLLHHLHAQ